MKSKFEMDDIIMIVMSFIHDMESGIEDDEIHVPFDIMHKINILSESEYDDFINKIYEIANNVFLFKTGELNELNMMHKSIRRMASEEMKEYL